MEESKQTKLMGMFDDGVNGIKTIVQFAIKETERADEAELKNIGYEKLLDEQDNKMKNISSIATGVDIDTTVKSRPHKGANVAHENGIVTGIKQLSDGRYKFRGEDVTIDGVRTHRGSGIFDTLAEAILHQNKVLESLFILGLIDEERLLRRRK